MRPEIEEDQAVRFIDIKKIEGYEWRTERNQKASLMRKELG